MRKKKYFPHKEAYQTSTTNIAGVTIEHDDTLSTLSFIYQGPYQTSTGNNILFFQSDNCIAPTVKDTGIWDRANTNFFIKNLKEGDVILELGSNVGYHTTLFSQLVGSSGKVYTYEALPIIYDLLKINLEANNATYNTEAFNLAVSNDCSPKTFGYYNSNPGASADASLYDLQKRSASLASDFSTMTTSSVILDDHLLDKLDRLDFIKMDIEGCEGLALQGMEKILEKFPKVKIISEYSISNDNGAYLEQLANLKNKGYKLYELINSCNENGYDLSEIPWEIDRYIENIVLLQEY